MIIPSLLLCLFILNHIVLAWCLGGYLIYLDKKRLHTKLVKGGAHRGVSILVPLYNEAAFVAAKVNNLLATIPASLDCEVLFVDGGSTDGSIDKLESLLPKNWKLLHSPERGKIAQLNFALRNISKSSSIVVNTDMDAEFSSNALEIVLNAFDSPDVGAAGATVLPGEAISLEKSFWEDQNFARRIESGFFAAGSIVAPLYAFRREIVSSFPDDCIADDLYVTFSSAARGYRVLQSSATVVELRAPITLAQFFRHKIRKATGVVKETIRFIPSVLTCGKRWRLLFLTRACQLFVVPYSIISLFALAVLLYHEKGPQFFVYLSLALPSTLVIVYLLVKLRASEPRGRSSIWFTLCSIACSQMVLICVHLTYLFLRPSSSYKKIR